MSRAPAGTPPVGCVASLVSTRNNCRLSRARPRRRSATLVVHREEIDLAEAIQQLTRDMRIGRGARRISQLNISGVSEYNWFR